MKVLTISLALVACVRMQVCGPDEEASPPPLPETGKQSQVSAAASPAPTPQPATVFAPAARHGGTVVVAGEHPIEVVTHASGEVYAYILSPTPPTGDLELRVEIPVAKRPPQAVTLRWDVRLKRYEGRARGVVFVPGPLIVHLVVGPQVWVGRATIIVIAPAVVFEIHQHKHKQHRKHRKHRHH